MSHHLDLSKFGKRVHRLIGRKCKYRLTAAADVCIHLHNCTLTQSQVDCLSDDTIHQIIREADRSVRYDVWRTRKRDLASAVAEIIELAVAPLAAMLTDEQSRVLSRARHNLSQECFADLSAGYSIRQTARRVGIDEKQIRRNLLKCRV